MDWGHLDTWTPGYTRHYHLARCTTLSQEEVRGDAENRYDEGGAALAVAGQSNRRLRPLVVRYS